jgi:hypothetical protein
MPRKYARHNRKKRKLTTRQQAFVKELAQGKTLTQAAKTAGYTDKNPAQAGYQALAQLRGRVPELLERHGLGEEVLIEKYLLPLLEATETKFFNGARNRSQCRLGHLPCRAADRILNGTRVMRLVIRKTPQRVRTIQGYTAPSGEFNQLIDVIPESAPRATGEPLNSTPTDPKPPATQSTAA